MMERSWRTDVYRYFPRRPALVQNGVTYDELVKKWEI